MLTSNFEKPNIVSLNFLIAAITLVDFLYYSIKFFIPFSFYTVFFFGFPVYNFSLTHCVIITRNNYMTVFVYFFCVGRAVIEISEKYILF